MSDLLRLIEREQDRLRGRPKTAWERRRESFRYWWPRLVAGTVNVWLGFFVVALTIEVAGIGWIVAYSLFHLDACR